MKDNSVLETVAILEHVQGSLCSNSRVQLSRTNLEAVQRLLGQGINKLANKDKLFAQVNFYMLGAHDLIATILEDDSFDRTDVETKEMLSKHVEDALNQLYPAAGKYYDTANEFDYYIGCDEILQRIIQICIKSGYYFGQVQKGD